MRAAQIGLRLGYHFVNYSLALPGLTFLSLVIILLSIVLFFVSIEKIITGIFIAHKAHLATIGLGILTIYIGWIGDGLSCGSSNSGSILFWICTTDGWICMNSRLNNK
jgi:hypothetical protein